MDYNKIWQFANEAYEGSGGFEDASAIDKHTRESDDKYNERKKIAYYTNKFSQKVSRYVGYLYSSTPLRMTNNNLLKEILDNADNAGNNIDVFMSGFAKTAKVRGSGLVLIDMPTEIPGSLGGQLETRALPYLIDVKPESVVKYKLDKYGKFEYIAYADTLDLSTYEEANIVEIERYFDKEQWIIYEGDDIREQGVHNLGVCPVVSFGENGSYPDIGEFTQISAISKRLYNLDSELDDVLRGQTFSILTLNADNPSDVVLTLSTDNAIKYGQGMNAPAFIAPDASPAGIYQEQILALNNSINEITYDVREGMSAQSGEALSIKFEGLNGSLSNFASRLENLENNIFFVVQTYLGMTEQIEIIYPNDFDIIDIAREVETLDTIKTMGYTLPLYEAAKLKQIIANDLNNLTPDEVAAISAEIDAASQEKPDVIEEVVPV